MRGWAVNSGSVSGVDGGSRPDHKLRREPAPGGGRETDVDGDGGVNLRRNGSGWMMRGSSRCRAGLFVPRPVPWC